MKKVVSIVLNNFKNDSRVLKESISLQNAGYDIKVVALYDEGQKEFEKIQNIPVHRIRLKSRSWSKNKIIQLLKYFEFIFRAVNQYKNNAVFHCNDLDALVIGVIVKKFFNRKAKIVYDAHEYETETKNLKGFTKKIVKILEKNLIKYADKVITVSDSIANEYVKLYNIKKPALVLNTPPYKIIEKKDLFREKLGIGKDKTIFLYQGGLSKGRGIEILLDTFKQLQITPITNHQSPITNTPVIVFMGYGPLEKMIKEDAQECENIYFHPAVALDMLLDYTSSADFGILFYENNCLNHYYCSPNKMFEYLMAEIPVIVSNLYEMKRLVEKYQIGIVAEENTPKGLQKVIEKAVKLDIEEVRKNIQKVKNIYNWENQEKVLLKVYEELVR